VARNCPVMAASCPDRAAAASFSASPSRARAAATNSGHRSHTAGVASECPSRLPGGNSDGTRAAASRIRIPCDVCEAALGLEPIIDALHRAPDLLHFFHALLDHSGCALVADGGAAGDQQHRPEGA
jgi:hypothetical protein